MKRIFALAALFSLPLAINTALAEEAKDEPKFTASAQLGFLYKTGNTKSADVKSGFNLRYESGKWRNVIAFNILAKKTEQKNTDGKDEFETTDNKWDIATQTNYTLGEEGKNYLYANISHEQDKFSGFESKSSISAGWGREWYKTKESTFFADVGPGIKYDVIRETTTEESNSNSNFIIQAQALYTTKINDFVEFKQYLVARQATQSNENSVYKSETSITTKLIESLQLKFAIRIDYDTEVEEGFENTNTETSMTLVYSF
ncbi:MAG: DUF481 domain-containing protein [Colwellia sp.]